MKCSRVFFKKNIKNMNNKMAINTHLSAIESKKQNKQKAKQKENHRYRECFDGCLIGGGSGRWVKKLKGSKSTNW